MPHSQSRSVLLQNWLSSQLSGAYTLTPLAGDASFRRYFRVQTEKDTFVVMDAPPDKENCLSFIKIAKILAAQKINVPEIKAMELNLGFLLLTDFGDNLFLRVLNESNANTLYSLAMDSLIRIQSTKTENHSLPSFDSMMIEELNNFREWYLEKHLNLNLTVKDNYFFTEIFEKLIESAKQQPQTFVHRDYHSRNLMLLVNNQVGILDFQDSVTGPITYDLVSLLRDCYIAWPISQVHEWTKKYLALILSEKILNNISQEQWLRWFDLMGIQRHLKAIFIFARKWHRDANSNYLVEIPRTLNYVLQVSEQYSDLKNLRHFLMSKVSSCL